MLLTHSCVLVLTQTYAPLWETGELIAGLPLRVDVLSGTSVGRNCIINAITTGEINSNGDSAGEDDSDDANDNSGSSTSSLFSNGGDDVVGDGSVESPYLLGSGEAVMLELLLFDEYGNTQTSSISEAANIEITLITTNIDPALSTTIPSSSLSSGITISHPSSDSSDSSSKDFFARHVYRALFSTTTAGDMQIHVAYQGEPFQNSPLHARVEPGLLYGPSTTAYLVDSNDDDGGDQDDSADDSSSANLVVLAGRLVELRVRGRDRFNNAAVAGSTAIASQFSCVLDVNDGEADSSFGLVHLEKENYITFFVTSVTGIARLTIYYGRLCMDLV